MKKVCLSIFMFFFIFQTVSAEKIPEVSLRLSRQDNFAKIVLDSDEEMVKNANTIVSVTSIKIEFPSPFTIRKTDSFTLEFSHRDKTVIISPGDAESARSYKLSSPARIVIELKLKQQDSAKNQKDQIQNKTDLQSPQQKTVAPPAGPDKSLKFRAVIIDAGHGGYDNGIYFNGLREKDLNLSLAKELSAVLQKKGIKVVLTRKADLAMSLSDRASTATAKTGDLIISIHASASDKFILNCAMVEESARIDPSVKFAAPQSPQKKHIEKSRAIAKAIAEALKTEYKTEIISRELPASILTMADTPAIMIEYPFSEKKTYDQKMREKLINSIAKGLLIHE